MDGAAVRRLAARGSGAAKTNDASKTAGADHLSEEANWFRSIAGLSGTVGTMLFDAALMPMILAVWALVAGIGAAIRVLD